MITEFQVQRHDLSQTRLIEHDTPALAQGQILAKVDRFALTANNVTYGVAGDKIGYWKFFPAPDEWGIIPVWGFADIVKSECPDVELGERLYGYFPMGSHLVLTPTNVRETSLRDGAKHRADLPPVYNSYSRVKNEADYDPSMDDERSLLYPLYATGYCLYDFLLDNEWFSAEQIILVSASSKTAIGTAMALKDDPNVPSIVGVTSAGNVDTVNRLGLYDSLVTYDDLGAVDTSVPAAIVDMSGNGAALSALHGHLKDNMKYCSNVGVTHWHENDMGPEFIRERSAMFFAPGHIQNRAKEWGAGVFEKKALAFWRDASIKSRAWLRIEEIPGLAAAEDAFHSIREGRSAPDKGVIVNVG